MRNFKDLEVYQESMDFVFELYKITKKFPDDEKFGMTSQLRRAGVSITNNIAEGCSRKTQKDFARFLEIALGSGFEVESMLTLSKRFEYLTADESDKLISEIKTIQKRTYALMKSVQNKS